MGTPSTGAGLEQLLLQPPSSGIARNEALILKLDDFKSIFFLFLDYIISFTRDMHALTCVATMKQFPNVYLMFSVV